MDELFEELLDKLPPSNDNGRIAGRIETAAALKEMMIGEPMMAWIRHGKIRRKIPLSDIAGAHYLFTNFHVAGHHGTDRQQVKVCAFAVKEKK